MNVKETPPSVHSIYNTSSLSMHTHLSVAASPHIRSQESVSYIMWQVIFALLPATMFGIAYFGFPALVTVLLSVGAAVACEAIIQKVSGQRITVRDGSAAVTGLLLALCLPPHVSWYIPVLGAIVSIGVAKHMMGGLGYNIFNPAHIGRAFLVASYPVAMTTFTASYLSRNAAEASFFTMDAITAATPLGILKQQGPVALHDQFGGITQLYKTMFFGTHAGCIGETSALLLLLGGAYLAVRGYIKWQTPLVMIATVGICAWIFGGAGGLFHGDPLFHMMSGGLIVGAFFMATDPVTVPITRSGQMLFACGAGILTILIRLVGGYPEGVCYALLLMNAVTPLIDKVIYPQKFGSV